MPMCCWKPPITNLDTFWNLEVQRTERWLVATGAKYVRYAAGTMIGGKKVGGQFARGRNVSAAYVNSKEQEVKRKVLAESERFFDEDAWMGQWDD